MGFFNKLAFWKKDDMGLDNDLGPDLKGSMDFGAAPGKMPGSDDFAFSPPTGMPDMSTFRGVGDFNSQQEMNRNIQQQVHGPDIPGFQTVPSKPPFGEARPTYPEQQSSSHELEVISAKLDAIRANLDAINQRLANLERVAYGEDDRKARW